MRRKSKKGHDRVLTILQKLYRVQLANLCQRTMNTGEKFGRENSLIHLMIIIDIIAIRIETM